MPSSPAVPATFTLPVLEDANSVQIALMQVIQLLLSGRIDSKTAGLLLYALQTASLNLKQNDLEPLTRERVVIDPSSVRDTPLGENPWDEQDFEEDDEGGDEDDEGDEESNEEETGEEQDEENEDGQFRGAQDPVKMLLDRLHLPGSGNDKRDHG